MYTGPVSKIVFLLTFNISVLSALNYIMKHVLYYCIGKDRLSGKYLHTNFQLKEKGEYIALIRPDGSVATTLDHIYPQQIPHVTYGIPDYPSDTSHFTYLDEPTPGKPNVGVLDKGPFISEYEKQQ